MALPGVQEQISHPLESDFVVQDNGQPIFGHGGFRTHFFSHSALFLNLWEIMIILNIFLQWQ